MDRDYCLLCEIHLNIIFKLSYVSFCIGVRLFLYAIRNKHKVLNVDNFITIDGYVKFLHSTCQNRGLHGLRGGRGRGFLGISSLLLQVGLILAKPLMRQFSTEKGNEG